MKSLLSMALLLITVAAIFINASAADLNDAQQWQIKAEIQQ